MAQGAAGTCPQTPGTRQVGRDVLHTTRTRTHACTRMHTCTRMYTCAHTCTHAHTCENRPCSTSTRGEAATGHVRTLWDRGQFLGSQPRADQGPNRPHQEQAPRKRANAPRSTVSGSLVSVYPGASDPVLEARVRCLLCFKASVVLFRSTPRVRHSGTGQWLRRPRPPLPSHLCQASGVKAVLQGGWVRRARGRDPPAAPRARPWGTTGELIWGGGGRWLETPYVAPWILWARRSSFPTRLVHSWPAALTAAPHGAGHTW